MNPPYTPTGCVSLDKIEGEQQQRIGLQSAPFGGKTTAAMTWPNPVVISYDQKLGAFTGRSDIIEVPFWDGSFVDKIVKRDGLKCPPNRKDALLVWLSTEGQKLQKGQTLVLDGSTGVETSFHMQYALNPQLTKQGDVDGFAEWRLKTVYFGELAMALKSVKCHVIYICHETPDRNAKGELTGLNRPLLTGQFGDQLASHFTDFFRVIAAKKPVPEKYDAFKAHFRIDDATAKEWLNSNPTQTVYLFQTQSDEAVKCGTSTLINAPKFILADYKTFQKYMRKKEETK